MGLYTGGEKNLGHELVRAGLCWWDRKYEDANLRQYEAQAREERRGLWKDPNPIPPWELRKQTRQKLNKAIDKILQNKTDTTH